MPIGRREGGTYLAAVGQSVHATLPSWMEDIGLGREVASSHRQLCRRLCGPVPRERCRGQPRAKQAAPMVKQEEPVEQSGPQALQRPISEAKLGPVLFGWLYG